MIGSTDIFVIEVKGCSAEQKSLTHNNCASVPNPSVDKGKGNVIYDGPSGPSLLLTMGCASGIIEPPVKDAKPENNDSFEGIIYVGGY